MAEESPKIDDGAGGEEKVNNVELFCLNDYDCIGFDMDHTIVQYHIEELFKVMDLSL